MAILEGINTILFWAGVYVLLWYAYILLFHKAVPNIKTAPAIRKTLIEKLHADIQAKNASTYTIIDLGCAQGDLSRTLARALPEAHIIGLDISQISIAQANLMKKWHKLRNVDYLCTDFMAYDLEKADAVLVYLTIYQMESVGQKLKDNLKPGTFVSSNRFALKAGWTPVETLEVKTLAPHQKQLYLYRA